jgi:hypothetical protein
MDALDWYQLVYGCDREKAQQMKEAGQAFLDCIGVYFPDPAVADDLADQGKPS